MNCVKSSVVVLLVGAIFRKRRDATNELPKRRERERKRARKKGRKRARDRFYLLPFLQAHEAGALESVRRERGGKRERKKEAERRKTY